MTEIPLSNHPDNGSTGRREFDDDEIDQRFGELTTDDTVGLLDMEQNQHNDSVERRLALRIHLEKLGIFPPDDGR